jgi:pimeloyl-ACP methyl ester carboxylesterase
VGPITPYQVAVPDAVLTDLEQRLNRTRLPVARDRYLHWRHGTDTAYLMQLLEYWRTTFDWREREREINAMPHFQFHTDAGPIHFVHLRSQHAGATPLILTHGWPWTFWDYAKVIGPLTDPTAHGGTPQDAFDVVIPSLLGFGFSTPTTAQPPVVWWEMADLWVELMSALGYEKFGAAGGDWGAWISAQLGHRHGDRLLGVHLFDAARLEMWGTDRPWDIFEQARAGLTPDQRRPWLAFERKAASHVAVHVLDPMTLAHSLTDSPAGLCSWLIERRHAWSDCGDDLESVYSKDELLTNLMIYWCTNSAASSLSIYANAADRPWQPAHPGEPVVSAPTALSTFSYHARKPGPWAQTYYDLRWHRTHDRGGHFAPAEVPAAVVTDLRESFTLFGSPD